MGTFRIISISARLLEVFQKTGLKLCTYMKFISENIFPGRNNDTYSVDSIKRTVHFAFHGLFFLDVQ